MRSIGRQKIPEFEQGLATRARLKLLVAMADGPLFRQMLESLVRAFEVESLRIETTDALQRELRTGQWDALVCDPSMDGGRWRGMLEWIRESVSDLPVVGISERIEEAHAGELIKRGMRAILGPSLMGRLGPILARELGEARERRLRELKVVIDSSPDPMLIVRADGSVHQANGLAEQLLGYREAELVGRPVELLVPPDARSRHAASRARYAAAPQARPMGLGTELTALHKDGHGIPVEISLGPVRLGGERLICCGLRDLRERRRAERLLLGILEGTARQTGEAFLRALVKNLARALEVRYAFISEVPQRGAAEARILAFWSDPDYTPPFDYALKGTPCEAVVEDGQLLVPAAVRARYPDDPRLRALNVECFFGVRLQSESGAALGLLAIADVGPLADERLARLIMDIFAARAGVELERMQTVAALADSEARFRTMAELTSDYYWEQDEHLRFTARIGLARERNAFPVDEMIGKTRWELPGHNLSAEDWRRHRADLEARREFHDLEIERPLPAGAKRWISVSGRPVFDAGGRFRGYRGVGKDITQRKLAEQALQETERLRDTLMRNLPGMAYRCANDPQWTVEFASEGCAQLTGYASEDLVGNRTLAYAELIHPQDRDNVWNTVQAGLAARKPFEIQYRIRSRDGAMKWVWERGRGVYDAAGKLAALEGYITDVTRRVESERARGEENDRVRLIADNVPAMIAFIDANYRFGYANRSYAEFYGEGGRLEGRSVAEALGAQTWRAARAGIERAMAGQAQFYVREHRRRSGKLRHVEVSLIPHVAPEGQVLGIYVLALDITQRRRRDEALRLRTRALDASVNSVMITEPGPAGQRIVYVNPAFERMSGYPAGEVMGRSPRILYGKEPVQPGIEALRAALRGQREETARLRNYRKDGTPFWVEVRVAPVRDDEGRVSHFVSVGSDITERVRYEEEIERHANYDHLTGLPNRNLLHDRLEHAIAKSGRSKRPVGVLYVDLDHLKRINDSLGHDVGDRVIAATGARLAETVRTDDTVARVGGDEFVIVLVDLKREDDAATVAQKIIHAVGDPLRIGAHEFVLTTSVGIAMYPKDGADASTLLRHADTALYRAKEQGRDCARFFAAEMNERVVRYLEIEQDMRKGIEAGEFLLQYQPVVSLASGECIGFEALVRWRRSDGSLVQPAQFIPVAEESGLIVPLGRWILDAAMRQAASWGARARQPRFVSVNLSARQFRDPRLVETVRAVLADSKVDPASIKLEITESAVMQDVDHAGRSLRALSDLGVQLSVDDFGTGYSSLAYLKRFPIDTLKIDRSFVRDLPADRDDLAICRAVIDLARGLGMDVVAEGIETREQAELLQAHGCGFAQGYYFGRPQDPGTIDVGRGPQPKRRKR